MKQLLDRTLAVLVSCNMRELGQVMRGVTNCEGLMLEGHETSGDAHRCGGREVWRAWCVGGFGWECGVCRTHTCSARRRWRCGGDVRWRVGLSRSVGVTGCQSMCFSCMCFSRLVPLLRRVCGLAAGDLRAAHPCSLPKVSTTAPPARLSEHRFQAAFRSEKARTCSKRSPSMSKKGWNSRAARRRAFLIWRARLQRCARNVKHHDPHAPPTVRAALPAHHA